MWHLLLNMFVLYSFGSVLESQWGTRVFWIFYVIASVVSSGVHAGLSFTPWLDDVPALGASGAVSGLLIAYSFLYPRHRILLFFILPVPAIAAALLFIGWDLYALVQQTRDNIGHGAHLGGAACGLAFYFFYLRSPRRRRRRAHRRSESQPMARDSDERELMDVLLEKIKRGGLDALTPQEREFMINMSERMRKGR